MVPPRASRPLPLAGEPEIQPYSGDILQDVFRIRTVRNANFISGGLSKPSKMPAFAYDIPATRCKLGSVLRDKAGTVCSECYALKNRFIFGSVQRALERQYRALFHALWVPALVLLIQKKRIEFFRWHTSGDVQSVAHVQNICTVARYTPRTSHWLPTREAGMVKAVSDVPENLIIRVSGHCIDGPPPKGFDHTSVVVSAPSRGDAFECPAPMQENSCGKCRACWNPAIPDVAYRLH